MFAADLMKFVTIPSEVTFVKLSSYEGLMSTGKVKEVFGLTENLSGRTVVIVEVPVTVPYTLAVIAAMIVVLPFVMSFISSRFKRKIPIWISALVAGVVLVLASVFVLPVVPIWTKRK